MTKEITRTELKKILQKKNQRVITEIFECVFDTKEEFIDALLFLDDDQLTKALQRYSWGFEVVKERK